MYREDAMPVGDERMMVDDEIWQVRDEVTKDRGKSTTIYTKLKVGLAATKMGDGTNQTGGKLSLNRNM